MFTQRVSKLRSALRIELEDDPDFRREDFEDPDSVAPAPFDLDSDAGDDAHPAPPSDDLPDRDPVVRKRKRGNSDSDDPSTSAYKARRNEIAYSAYSSFLKSLR